MVEALGVADLCRTSETEKMPRFGEPGGAIMGTTGTVGG